MDDLTADRIQQNNRIFREANEQIHQAVTQHDSDVDRIPFICECPVEACVEVVRLTEHEYAAVRADPSHFVTAVGHEEAERPVGHVVARENGYVVIEKK